MTTKTSKADEGGKTFYALRNFKDAGTEREFPAGEALTDVEAGAIANYFAAGLVSEQRPA